MKINHVQQTTSHFYKSMDDKNTPNENKSNIQTTAVIISDEAQNKYNQSLKLKAASEDDSIVLQFRKAYEELNSPEAIEQRRLEQLEKEQAYNLLTDEFSLHHVKYHFPENTLHRTITEVLEGKVVNASLYAAELAGAIRSSVRSSVSMPDKSAEERAAYREMALKQAEYVAENYIDNEEEAISFMNEINKYYENDMLREKGYVVFDNGDLEPFRNYSSPLSKEFNRKYSKEIIEEFELNQQQAEKRITATKSMFESFVWENGLVIGTMEEQPNYLAELLKWNQDMLNLFY